MNTAGMASTTAAANAAGERLIIGMGASGMSLASYWQHDCPRCPLTVVDDRAAPPFHAEMVEQLPQVHLRCGEDFRVWGEQDYASFNLIGVSPGIAPDVINAPAARLTNDAACFSAAWRALAPAESRLIAITGTNGKSTVTALVAHLAAAAGMTSHAVGNIGEPMLDALLLWRARGFPMLAVVELSSFQLELASRFYSDAAVVLNVGDDHLDRHGDREHYAAIKAAIYSECGCVVMNAQQGSYPASMTMPAPALTYAVEANVAADWTVADGWICRGGKPRFEVGGMSPACRQYLELVLAALALLEMLGLPDAGVREGLATFGGLAHRCEFVAEVDGVRYVNDSKATNVEAALFALSCNDGNVVWIGGGDGKGQDFAALTGEVAKMRAAVLLGQDALALAEVLDAAAVPCELASQMDEAVQKARRLARRGDTVLLSPACSSLDMYENYRARGALFAQAVRDLQQDKQQGGGNVV